MEKSLKQIKNPRKFTLTIKDGDYRDITISSECEIIPTGEHNKIIKLKN